VVRGQPELGAARAQRSVGQWRQIVDVFALNKFGGPVSPLLMPTAVLLG